MQIINLLIFKTDDHLRNHGFVLVHHDFILAPSKGGRLSDAYELNLVVDSHGMKPTIIESDNALNWDPEYNSDWIQRSGLLDCLTSITLSGWRQLE